MTNIEKLRETMAFIVANPEKHDQSEWTVHTGCGTAACFAGWTCLLNGFKVNPALSEDDDGIASILVVDDGGKKYNVADMAEEILDLEPEDAGILFHGANTLDSLQKMIDDLAAGKTLEAYWSFWYDQDQDRYIFVRDEEQ